MFSTLPDKHGVAKPSPALLLAPPRTKDPSPASVVCLAATGRFSAETILLNSSRISMIVVSLFAGRTAGPTLASTLVLLLLNGQSPGALPPAGLSWRATLPPTAIVNLKFIDL